jgi:hypothetical protein
VTIVLFTEDGPTGEAIKILARKILSATGKNLEIKRRQVNQGDIFKNPRKLAALIQLVSAKGKSKIIVCVDSECTDPSIIERNLEPCKRAVKGLQSVVHFVIVVHALETWLATDEEALRVILKADKKIKIPGNLENECRPGSILQEIFRKHGRKFIKSKDDLTIAEHADPAQIAQRCTSFKKIPAVPSKQIRWSTK